MLKAIVLDFDGVILESVDIKTRAFRVLFKDYPECLEGIVRLHLGNGGISRYEKFEVIYRDLLRRPLSEDHKSRLGAEFSAIVADEMLRCPYVSGAIEFLAGKSRHYPLFVVSGTPETELLEIVKKRNLTRYFHRVYGSPRSKDCLLREILASHQFQAPEVVYIGDSLTDCMASASVGMHFIGRVQAGSPSPFPASLQWTVSDLDELSHSWAAIVADFS